MSSNTANFYKSPPNIQIQRDYTDILQAQRPLAPHPMEITDRAAQFAPYAALVGHQEIISADEELAENVIDRKHEITFDETA